MTTYASLSNTQIDLTIPTNVVGCNLECRNCIHFAHVPRFKVSTNPTVCSSPTIGRDPGATPCIEYKASGMSFLTGMPKPLVRELMRFLTKSRKSLKYKTKQQLFTTDLIAFLSAYAYSLKRDIPIGEEVTVDNSDIVQGLTPPGSLIETHTEMQRPGLKSKPGRETQSQTAKTRPGRTGAWRCLSWRAFRRRMARSSSREQSPTAWHRSCIGRSSCRRWPASE